MWENGITSSTHFIYPSSISIAHNSISNAQPTKGRIALHDAGRTNHTNLLLHELLLEEHRIQVIHFLQSSSTKHRMCICAKSIYTRNRCAPLRWRGYLNCIYLNFALHVCMYYIHTEIKITFLYSSWNKRVLCVRGNNSQRLSMVRDAWWLLPIYIVLCISTWSSLACPSDANRHNIGQHSSGETNN